MKINLKNNYTIKQQIGDLRPGDRFVYGGLAYTRGRPEMASVPDVGLGNYIICKADNGIVHSLPVDKWVDTPNLVRTQPVNGLDIGSFFKFNGDLYVRTGPDNPDESTPCLNLHAKVDIPFYWGTNVQPIDVEITEL